VNEKIKKGLKNEYHSSSSIGGIKLRNTKKANKLLSEFNQKNKVGVKTEEEKEVDKLEKDAREKDAENLRLANLDRMKKTGAERERKMSEWAEQDEFRKLFKQKLENRSFKEKYLVSGGTKVLLLVILIVLGSVLGTLVGKHQDDSEDRKVGFLVLIFMWSVGSIALTIHSYYKLKEFTDNHEQKQKETYNLEIRNTNLNV